MKLIRLVPFIALGMLGCADTHGINVSTAESNMKLSSSDAVYVARSKDGQYGTKQYTGSGATLSQAIQSSLIRKMDNIVVAEQYQPYSDALQYAEKHKFNYLIYPTIMHWEDRATEWSGKPDVVEVKVSVVEVNNKTVIKSGIINGKSGLFTFGGDKPQDLLGEPLNTYLDSVIE
ncbi:DUF4823 domain-containing protein [Vibrio sp. UCD-FRSSP16_10]|uniref:DUF4823 domain-containing protein n=1 Tax=unclassified Vibrio TaxID=2614977 RepID=UPI0007FF23D7|nr:MULTISPECIES: DUF4823 domain-containing protein [unclassified Vibrio]OBT14765.1 DUF4823 domain-containing protein [Vibrio sp. UCD-FRSSP16_30]OBT20054.1 DUF4823 domain-containing protein [Vibrio sp. UCD-FRSSP16_10]